jgi:CDP-diacylglycerol--serine O-phosphatidyltransferase
MSEQHSKSRSKGVYLLPNLITTGGLFAGFYAIIAGMRGDFSFAALAIYGAMLMDGLDGRVARLTNTQSEFGAEYDSLADVVSFGIAPSLVAYSWGLMSLGKIGWLAAFFYAAATALRLARFNVKTGDDEKASEYFQGLPSPAAGGLIAGMVSVADEYGVPGLKLWDLAAVVTFLTAILMVSSIPYYSFKHFQLRGKVPFIALLAVLVAIVFISLDPPQIVLTVFALYVISGPVFVLKNWVMGKKKLENSIQNGRDETDDL